jgi:hypothetical protein
MGPSAIHESGHFYFAQTGHSHFAATGFKYEESFLAVRTMVAVCRADRHDFAFQRYAGARANRQL